MGDKHDTKPSANDVEAENTDDLFQDLDIGDDELELLLNEEDKVDTINAFIPKSAVAPGKLRGESNLVLHTKIAQKALYGRRAGKNNKTGSPIQPITGLFGFASKMGRLLSRSLMDDPYADWSLIKIEKSMGLVTTRLSALQELVDSRLEQFAGVVHEIADSELPSSVPLEFGNPYGYQGAGLIANLDKLGRSLLTAGHVGAIDPNESAVILMEARKKIRRIFALSANFVPRGATRKDIFEMTARGMDSVSKYGQLPPLKLLNNEVRAKFAPRVNNSYADRFQDETSVKVFSDRMKALVSDKKTTKPAPVKTSKVTTKKIVAEAKKTVKAEAAAS